MPYTAGTAWEGENRSITAYLTILSGSQPYAEDDFNTISVIGIESELVSTKNLSFGNTCSTKATVSLKKVKADFKSYLTKGTGVLLELECSASGATLGYNGYLLYIDEIESMESRETYTENGTTHYYNDITLVCYDTFYKTEIPYVPTITISAESPKNLLAVAKDVMKVAGFTSTETKNYAQGFSTDLTIDSIPENVSCREMLGYLAGYQGGNCIFKTDYVNNEPFTYVSPVIVVDSTAKTITQDEQYMDAYIIGGNLVELNRVESGTADSIAVYPSNGEIGNSISYENPYIQNDAAGLARVQAIQEAVIAKARAIQDPSADSLDYTPMEVQWRGNPQILVGEMVKVEDKYGNTQYCLIMGKSISFDGGLSETYKCYGETEKSVSFTINPVMKQIERRLTAMEEEILKATAVISDTSGSVFEIIPDDPTNPTKNTGWKLYNSDGSNYILATSNGIGFSSNGGQSFITGIYIDPQTGGGHIYGQLIVANSITTDKINFTQPSSSFTNAVDGAVQAAINSGGITIGNGQITGMSDDLATILGNLDSDVTTANTNATSAVSTANSASSAASAAASAASSADTKATAAQNLAQNVNATIASWAYGSGTTYIDGAKIYSGTITAEQLNLGWQAGNLASSSKWTNPGYDDAQYLKMSVDENGNLKCSAVQSFTSAEKKLYSAPFYMATGAKVKMSATFNLAGASGYTADITLQSSSTINGTFSDITDAKITPSTPAKDYTTTQSRYYRLKLRGYKLSDTATITNIYVTYTVTGTMVVNGSIKSNDGETYFDLDNSKIVTTGDFYQTVLYDGALEFYTHSGSSQTLRGLISTPSWQDTGETSSHYAVGLYYVQGSATCATLGMRSSDGQSFYPALQAYYNGGNSYARVFSNFGGYETVDSQGYKGKFGIGNASYSGSTYKSASLQVMYGDAYYARLDCIGFGNGGGAIRCQNGSGPSASPWLVLGTGTLYWDGTPISSNSSEEYKKDIETFMGNATNVIESAKIYKFHYKEEESLDPLRYGLIIERECPTEVVEKTGKAVSVYSMTSLAWKAIQELNNRIKELEEKYERKS